MAPLPLLAPSNGPIGPFPLMKNYFPKSWIWWQIKVFHPLPIDAIPTFGRRIWINLYLPICFVLLGFKSSKRFKWPNRGNPTRAIGLYDPGNITKIQKFWNSQKNDSLSCWVNRELAGRIISLSANMYEKYACIFAWKNVCT